MPDLRLRRLRGSADDLALFQRLLEAAPGYHLDHVGRAPAPDEAARDFALLPPGVGPEGRHVLAVEVDGEAVGVADVGRGYPSAEHAFIGLLLLAESHQGRGLGRAAFEALLAYIAAWPEIRRLRLAVLVSNVPALRFWEAMGFRATGERKPFEGGPREVFLYERAFSSPEGTP